MGLSNEERFDKIIHSVSHIDDARKKLTNSQYYEVGRLPELTNKLWYELLKGKSNSAFWLFGGELHNENLEKGLIGTAFSSHQPKKYCEFNTLEGTPQERQDWMKYYDRAREFTSISHLVGKDNPAKSAVVNVYLHTENIVYALCRYDDDFTDSLKDLHMVICQIQGECFKIFKRDPSYTQAWMISSMLDKVLTMYEGQLVNKWWQKYSLHHAICIESNEFEKIFHVFRKQQFKQLTMQQRVNITLMLIGDRFHFKHQQKECLKMVEEHNVANPKDKVAIKPLETAFKKPFDPVTKPEKDYNRNCNFTGNSEWNDKIYNSRYDR